MLGGAVWGICILRNTLERRFYFYTRSRHFVSLKSDRDRKAKQRVTAMQQIGDQRKSDKMLVSLRSA